MITENDPEEQEKRIKYLDLVASAVILHNAVDLSLTIQQLSAEGVRIDRQMLVSLSPYLTRHFVAVWGFCHRSPDYSDATGRCDFHPAL